MRLYNYITIAAIALSLLAFVACKGETVQNDKNDNYNDSIGCNEETTTDTIEEEVYLKKVSTMGELLEVEPMTYYEPIYEDEELTAQDEKILELANRVITMYAHVDYSNPDTVWMWAEATDKVVRQYAKSNKIEYDSAVHVLEDALEYFCYDVHSQSSMNINAVYKTTIRAYQAVMAYKQMIDKIADKELKRLVRAEYNAWFEWFDAEYFREVYYVHGKDSYSMLPLEFGSFNKYQTDNRLTTLRIEQEVLVNGKSYRQKGKTVTSKQWHKWLDEQGYEEGMSPEFNMDNPYMTDFPALIKDKTERWLAARQAVATYLGDKKGPGQSYDNLTADIHSCIIGQLKPLVKPLEI